MNMIIETDLRTPVVSETDVVVVGGGPAGSAAAIQAGRRGASVVLLEQSGMLGGVATSGLMSHWTGETGGGIYEEILDRSRELEKSWNAGFIEENTSVHKIEKMGFNGTAKALINHEVLRSVLLEMCAEAKVDVRLYTFASAPILETAEGKNPRVTGVIAQGKGGREAFRAKVVIDASGDGDMAAAAGVPFVKGREYDGKMQPMTSMLKVGGVDTAIVEYATSFEDSYPIPSGDLQTVSRKHIPYPAGHVLIYPSTLPGTVVLNMTNAIKVDGTKAADLTRAELTCRSQIKPIMDFLRAEVPGFSKAYLIQSASMVGVRETRHFRGEATINERDILDARIFGDWVVANAHFNLDVHNLEGSGLDPTGVQRNFSQRHGYTIPYGCFVPLGADGLLIAGRCISGTHMAHSSYRVMPICANMGQAVGVAAAMAAKTGTEPRLLDVRAIQTVLKGLGVDPERKN